MRIGIDARFMSKGSETGGLGRYSFELIHHLLQIDHQHQYVLFVKDKNDLPQFIKKSTKRVEIISTGIKHYCLAEQTLLPRIIRDAQCDLVHFSHFNHPIAYSGKFVITIHDLTLSRFPGRQENPLKKLAYHWVVRHAIQKSQAVIAVSEWTKKEILKAYQVSPQKIKVIYEGVDPRQFQRPSPKIISQALKKYHLPCPYIVSVGQFRPHKNLLRLCEAFKSIKIKHPELKLVFVGKIDPLLPLPQKVRELGLENDVVYTGFVKTQDLPAIYAGAVAFVFPSLAEGFGLPGLEAMAAGTPVIASNSSCLPEIFGEAAVYFDPYDIGEMAKMIEKVSTNSQLAKKLAQGGYRRIQKYSWEKMAEETLNLYKKVIG